MRECQEGTVVGQLVDELNLSPNIRTAHPPRLPLPDHVHGLVSLDRSPRRLKLAKPLLGLYSSFDRSMILLRMLFKYWTCRWGKRVSFPVKWTTQK